MLGLYFEPFEFQREKFAIKQEISGRLLTVTSLKVIDSILISRLNRDAINILFLKILLIYFQRKAKGRRKSGARNMDQLTLACPQPGTWLTTQAYALTQNQTGNLSVCSTTPNPLSYSNLGEVYQEKLHLIYPLRYNKKGLKQMN